ncbi:MAG: pantetheine-phosphate adenylyltransferase [Theionarchaea archaeon]|nr:pantetheine-phosphate adenylyltransferase [Theionarchaea archaeon]
MKIIASGTFDHFHDGHKYFLQEAFNRGYVMIGLCADSMFKTKEYVEKIYPYEKRKHDLVQYLTKKGHTYGKDYMIEKIEDKFGFAVNIRNIDAILVTPEVRKNAEEINEVRKGKEWHELEIVEVPLLKDDKGVISSTRLRQSE